MTTRMLDKKDLLIAPSLLAADFSKLGGEIDTIPSADILHVDIMDGNFVPNISFGPNALHLARSRFGGLIDAHLMVTCPETLLPTIILCKPDIITFHLEATPHANRLIQSIHEAGLYAGIAINPATPVSLLEDCVELVDMMLIMSVNPGFGGQSFITQSLDKIRRLRHMCGLHRVNPRIEVDGGIDNERAKEVVQSGADILVAGSAIFSHADREAAIQSLYLAGRSGLGRLA